MTDNMTPQLTLDPTAAAAEAVPTLTLTPEAPEAPQVEEEKKIEPVEMDEKLLTDAEKKAVEDFSHKIDIRDTNMILQYGAAAQKSVAGFSENALNSVRNKDLGEIGKDLSQLVVELKGFGEEEEKKGLAGLFRRTRQPAGDHEGPVRQGGGQRGQDRPEPGAAPDHPAEGCGHV